MIEAGKTYHIRNTEGKILSHTVVSIGKNNLVYHSGDPISTKVASIDVFERVIKKYGVKEA